MSCEHCGSENPYGGKFCNQCGESLLKSLSSLPAPPPPPPSSVTTPPKKSGKKASAIGALIILFAIVGSAGLLYWDMDGDGLRTYEELQEGTAYDNADSDGDKINDYDEIRVYKTNPNSPDSDGDLITDNDEIKVWSTDPTSKDTDKDLLDDYSEIYQYQTDPNKKDSEGDGLNDYEEVMVHYTNPTSSDSDGDELNDKEELDGWSKLGFTWKTKPTKKDSDNDGVDDNEDNAPIGNLVINFEFTEWEAPDEWQDFLSTPDPWIWVYNNEDEHNRSDSWVDQTSWKGQYLMTFDVDDRNDTTAFAIVFCDWDGAGSENPTYEGSELMDIDALNPGSETTDQYLAINYHLWNNNHEGKKTVTGDVEQNGIHGKHAASERDQYSIVSITQDGNDDGDTGQYDCSITFRVWWSIENSIEEGLAFYFSDKDGDRTLDFLDYNDELDAGLEIVLENFGFTGDIDFWDSYGEAYFEIFLDGELIAYVGEAGSYISMEIGKFYPLNKVIFANLDDTVRYHHVTIKAWDEDLFLSDPCDIDGTSIDINNLDLIFDIHTGTWTGNDLDGVADGRHDGYSGTDDGLLYYDLKLVDTAERGIDKTFIWQYQYKSFEYNVQLSSDTYYDFKGKDHSIVTYNDFARFVTPEQQYIVDIANDLEIKAATNGYNDVETVNFVLSFVQNIDYQFDNVSTGSDEYPRYPIEMLFEEVGDCEDSSALFASLMEAMGYDVILLLMAGDENYGGHAAVGVAVAGGSGTHYEKDSTDYYYCETTATGWELGKYPYPESRSAYLIRV